MKKSFFGLIILFIFLTTYTPKFDFIMDFDFSIQKIKIEGNAILNSDEIAQKLNFLYRENLFFLNLKDIEKNLKNETFIESFSLKKVYPNTLKIVIAEKEPIAVLHNKKKKFYISNKGDFINFSDIEKYKDLPIVFVNGKFFYSLYRDLKDIKFPLKGLRILDIGCGGGLISEPLTRLGADVTGIDASKKNIKIASLHAKKNNLKIEYLDKSPEQMDDKKKFDVLLQKKLMFQ